MTTQEALRKHWDILLAAKDGKIIQSRYAHRAGCETEWMDDSRFLVSLVHDTAEFRVKPREPRRVWINNCPSAGWMSSTFYRSREEAAESFVRGEGVFPSEFVEVLPKEEP